MDKVCVYYKCVVVKLDPFCESCIIVDKNCAQFELNALKIEIRTKYPNRDGYTSVFRKQKLNID